MLTLLDIANRLGDDDDLDFHNSKDEYHWRPLTTDNYTVPDFCIDVSNAKGAKGKFNNSLSKVLAFVNNIKHRRSKTKCTIMTIPVKNKTNLAIWGSDKSVSNGIALMKKIGLISIENEMFRHHARNKKDNMAKTYRYYYENEQKLLQYCSTHGIEAAKVENHIYKIDPSKPYRTDIDPSKVRFSHQLRLSKPSDMSVSEFEEALSLCLYENYPELTLHIDKANEMNDKFYRDYPEFRITFQPNFHWNSKKTMVTKIGIRATNPMANTRKEDRKDILKAYGLTLEKDINASVPRMTLSLNSGHWVDYTGDIYELIYRNMGEAGEFTSEIREALKQLHMRAYFESSAKQVGHHTWLKMDQEGIDKTDVNNTMCKLRGAIVMSEGDRLYGSDIFYVESCVYLMTLYDLLNAGHMVWPIYDCFYSTGNETQEEFEELVLNGIKINFMYFYQTWHKKHGDIAPQ